MCGVNLYICQIMMEYVMICYVSLSNWTWSFSHWSRPTPDAEKKRSHHWVAGSSTGSNANISGQSPAIHSFLLCFHLLISHCIILHHDFGWLDWLEVKVYGSSPPLAGDFRVGFQDPTPPTYAFLGASSSRWPTSRKAKAAPWDRQECFHPKWWSAWWFGTMEFYDFPFSWECHHPNWRSHIFQRGRSTINQWFFSEGKMLVLAHMDIFHRGEWWVYLENCGLKWGNPGCMMGISCGYNMI